MYVCLECGTIFKKPSKHTEYHGLDSPPYEEMSGCPRCDGGYVETVKCDCCDNYITDDFIVVKDKIYCDDCADKHSVEDLAFIN